MLVIVANRVCNNCTCDIIPAASSTSTSDSNLASFAAFRWHASSFAAQFVMSVAQDAVAKLTKMVTKAVAIRTTTTSEMFFVDDLI